MTLHYSKVLMSEQSKLRWKEFKGSSTNGAEFT